MYLEFQDQSRLKAICIGMERRRERKFNIQNEKFKKNEGLDEKEREGGKILRLLILHLSF